MQTTKSIFEIWTPPNETINKENIFNQIDKFIQRDLTSKWETGEVLQTWRQGDNCEVFVFTKADEITRISFRFDHSNIDHKFKSDIIDFAERNGFKISINQRLIFSPGQLTTDLINENYEIVKELDDPLTFLKKQK